MQQGIGSRFSSLQIMYPDAAFESLPLPRHKCSLPPEADTLHSAPTGINAKALQKAKNSEPNESKLTLHKKQSPPLGVESLARCRWRGTWSQAQDPHDFRVEFEHFQDGGLGLSDLPAEA